MNLESRKAGNTEHETHMSNKTKTKQAKAKKASKFITLPDGTLIRKSAVVMVESDPGTLAAGSKTKLRNKPVVFVTWVAAGSTGSKMLAFERDVEQRVCMTLIRHVLV